MEHPDAEPEEPVCRDGDQGRELGVEAVAIEEDAAMRLFCLGEVSDDPGPLHLYRRDENSALCLLMYRLYCNLESAQLLVINRKQKNFAPLCKIRSSAKVSSKIRHIGILPGPSPIPTLALEVTRRRCHLLVSRALETQNKYNFIQH